MSVTDEGSYLKITPVIPSTRGRRRCCGLEATSRGHNDARTIAAAPEAVTVAWYRSEYHCHLYSNCWPSWLTDYGADHCLYGQPWSERDNEV